MLVEVVLEPLVSEVDAELFEAVVLVVLEAEDVQHPYREDLHDNTTTSYNFQFEITTLIWFKKIQH